ncbi:protein of unknown function [Prosthecobacter debontii]|uniref:DUF4268 domain-containing protein n=1 Tax=Prosthecobacter debontii TaxID=48467 RepID=A0A1T4Y973_9BACT|nr:DUF4268 domain-containing protein [Prosthecobacter debontii]SKA97831.1 protein of unknown function [Prosthecobacter debontii]
MRVPELGRLEKVSLREAWLTEAQDFTPWLAQGKNLALLGQALEMDLETEFQEKRVGPFRADILCRDRSDDSWVLIENQLERTDHSHLGQLLTYAAGLSAVSIVWIAERFTDEHRAALDWLNEKTQEGVNFFGLEVELWRIGNSPVAPKFNIVSKPNAWTRRVIEARHPNNDKQQLCLDFWQPIYDQVQAQDLPLQRVAPLRRKDTVFMVGWHTFRLKAYFSTVKKESAVWISCRGPKGLENFETLKNHQYEIEAAFGEALQWSPQPLKNSGSILTTLSQYGASHKET